MRGQETDHVISGPMRGLDKNCMRWRRQTSGHRDSMTDPAQRAESVKRDIVFRIPHIYHFCKFL